ncbi:hypothetical protein B0A48_08855 [Cryoendolithus antarcticus]|uniref:Uncharacterized protein n=1 Tax=Cryoendolithus antarcticus TaxID=1507870 RepID=A0A1V8T4C4_9PEZI|nr:hypothetical protein B0A48_08855 [Cryoendolithus antarcticus]
MASQDEPRIDDEDWRERLNDLIGRGAFSVTKTIQHEVKAAEPGVKMIEPEVKIVDPVPSPTSTLNASDDTAPTGADAWKEEWWAMSNRALVPDGRETTSFNDNISMHARERSTNAENERVYQFFQMRYGGDNNSLPAWQKLCEDVEVAIGSSIDDCKAILKLVYVYINQFVDAVGSSGKIEKFPTFEPLRVRIKRLPFPLEKAKDNLFLQVMLRKTSLPKGIFAVEERDGLTASASALRPQSRGPTRQAPRSNVMSSVNARIAEIKARKAAAKDRVNGNREVPEVTDMVGSVELSDDTSAGDGAEATATGHRTDGWARAPRGPPRTLRI